MFTQKKSLQHTIAQLEERIQELEAELKQKDIEKTRDYFDYPRSCTKRCTRASTCK
ncbi:hypothetical protein ACT7DZ_20340 [Bacillus cereus]